MPNKKIRGGCASTLIKYVSGADAPANVNPGGQTPQAMMPNCMTCGVPENFPPAANFSKGGSSSTRKGGRRATRIGRRRLRRRLRRRGRRRSTKKGGGVLATAALPFGLFGLQRLFGKRFTRKLRNMF